MSYLACSDGSIVKAIVSLFFHKSILCYDIVPFFFAFVCHISILRGVFYILLLFVMLFFIRHIRLTLLGLCSIVGGVLLTQISRDTMSLDGLF